ncbi:hypothetical protein F1880_001416 [Penicillium rolfsii]|nr:hypothetical protein F1880_001416 [Penicillium rolfsii]
MAALSSMTLVCSMLTGRVGETAKAMSWIGYHHILMVFTIIAITLLSVLLAGCTSSNSLSNVYLLSLQYKATSSPIATVPGQVSTAISQAVHNLSQSGNSTNLEVRVGYMGLCVTQRDTGRICSSSARVLANLIRAEKVFIKNENVTSEMTPDPLNLIMIANEFKEKIVFDGLIFIVVILTFICFLLLSTFPGWHNEVDETGSEREVKPFPSQHVVVACLFVSGIGFGFSLISILWQHINSSSTASMAETLTYGTVTGHVGGVAMALGWAAVGLIAFVGFGLFVMKLSIDILERVIAMDTVDESSEEFASMLSDSTVGV